MALDLDSLAGAALGSLTGAASEPIPQYKTLYTNWYQSSPYSFQWWDVSKSGINVAPKEAIYLPISPQNLTINTHMATNVITTLYGIVEEHSEVRFYDITIQGNTGIAPTYLAARTFGASQSAGPIVSQPADLAKADTPIPPNSNASPHYRSVGREAFPQSLNLLGGLLPGVSGTFSQVLDNAQSAIANVGQFFGLETNKTGISPVQSGYAAFHALYKFFLRYKDDASQSNGAVNGGELRAIHPLSFVNYKDGVKYKVVPLSFTMVRSAENPMLYNYIIKIRGFDMREVSAPYSISIQSTLNTLGLGNPNPLSGVFSALTGAIGDVGATISGLF